MESTSLTLLERVRQPGDAAAWNRFVALYTPLLLAYARRLGLQDADAIDLVQEVLVLLLRQMPRFVHDGQHSFRGWLKTVARNCWLARRPRQASVSLEAVAEPASADVAEELIEREYLQSIARRALLLMQTDFEPATWRACWETAVEGRPAGEVASELGLSVGAVYVARSRVLARLRQELAGLLE